jgi:hypothetical protein
MAFLCLLTGSPGSKTTLVIGVLIMLLLLAA